MKNHANKFDPSLPLRNPRHETYARQRVLLVPPVVAMRKAEPPYDKPTPGNAARLDRHPHIVSRVRHLAAADGDMDMIRLRRARIRDLLERLALADRTKLFEEIEVPERDENDCAIIIDGKPMMRVVRRLRSFDDMTDDERLLVEGMEFEGEKEKVKTVERLPAIAQLRKLDGLDRPDKVAMTDAEGKTLTPVAPTINLYGRPPDQVSDES